ncbi:uncharacterized protein LOC141594785 [Silene latifolia]|uniref:uncharacterized protein LOC141594785 n=1 Tax=Silene latifolia TaxID=37657 RepID=UPI003D787B6D
MLFFACELQDIKTTGAFFTWTNKQPSETRVYSRIDRVLVNNEWMRKWPDYYAYYAPEGYFDHCPCLVDCVSGSIPRRKPFKFFNMRSKVSDFQEVVKVGWNCDIQGTYMFRIAKKLKLLKPMLKNLNKAVIF